MSSTSKGSNKELEVKHYLETTYGAVVEKALFTMYKKDFFILPLTAEEEQTLPLEEIKKRRRNGLFDLTAKMPAARNETWHVQVKSHLPGPNEPLWDRIKRFKAGWGTTTDKFYVAVLEDAKWVNVFLECKCGRIPYSLKKKCPSCMKKYQKIKSLVPRKLDWYLL